MGEKRKHDELVESGRNLDGSTFAQAATTKRNLDIILTSDPPYFESWPSLAYVISYIVYGTAQPLGRNKKLQVSLPENAEEILINLRIPPEVFNLNVST